MSRDRYHVTITLQREEEPAQVSLALSEAFSDTQVDVATPDFVAGDQARHEITIDFEHLNEKLRAEPQAELDEREREAVQQFARLQVEPSAIVAVVRALVSLAGARRRAGLSARQRFTVDVEPESPPHLRWDEREEL